MDSQSAKEKALEDLRKIKEELLQRNRNSNNQPSKPISKLKSLSKKEKKVKRKKTHKAKHSHKKHKKSDKHKSGSRKRHPSTSSSSSSDSDSDQQKQITSPKKRSCSPELERDEWMTSSVLVKTFSKDKPLQKKQCQAYEAYEPGKSVRELNPHWKNGGSGLPTFRKPREDSDDDNSQDYSKSMKYSTDGYKKRDWMKKTDTKSVPSVEKSQQDEPSSSSKQLDEQEKSEFLTDQQMNELGAKIMKAELMNNNKLAEELKNKLNSARTAREQNTGKGSDKPRSSSHRKSHHETPHRNRAPRNMLDDDENDLKKKFAKETSGSKPENDDVDEESDGRDRQNRHNNCDKCMNSHKMKKEFIVSMGKHVYLALPWHEGLQANHCLIIPIDHYSCSTALDEDVWQEISSYRRVLTKIFAKRKEDVLFFETARHLQKRRHMVIHCVPSAEFEMAPFYFKKAIEESEYEWSKNKQLVTLKDKNLRKSIPCGLPYFWVHFGMDYGFAHVIENQEMFPLHFAQEIIGGMLTLDMRRWRTPREEHNVRTKVKNLADLLKPYESELES